MAEAWRDEARNRLPDLTEEIGGWDLIDSSKTFEQLCLQLHVSMWTLYDEAGVIGDRRVHTELNRERIARIYEFATWCLDQSDLRGIVLFYFWESLGPNINPAIHREMPAFLTKAQLQELKREGIFPPKRDADEQRDVRRRGKRRN